MDKIIEILQQIDSDTDFSTADNLVESGILTSLDIVMLVSELNDEFDIEITPIDIVPANFKSAQTIYDMVKRIEEE